MGSGSFLSRECLGNRYLRLKKCKTWCILHYSRGSLPICHKSMQKQEEQGSEMYSRKAQGWREHIDFILWDVVCLHIAFVLAYITRHGFSNPYGSTIYFSLSIIYTLVDVLVMIINRTMQGVLKRGYYKELAQTVKHVFFVSVLIAVYMFAAQIGDEYSRITFFLLSGYYIVLTYVVRLAWKKLLLTKRNNTVGAAIYFVTTESRASKVLSRFQKNSIGANLIQGMCILDRDCTGQTIANVPVTASRETLLKFLQDKWVDEVFVSLPATYAGGNELISAIADMGIVVHVAMDQLHLQQGQHQVIEEIAGATVRTVSMSMATPLQHILKRVLDIIGALIGCVLTVILTLIIGPIIYIKSPGPIFFVQERVGKNGRKFKLYKFRSMYVNAEARKAELMAQNRMQGGLMFKLDYDPRIIGCEKRPDGTIKKGIGNYIRDWSLDEFPQFFNVLKGDLSLVGTRPPTVDEWEQYELHHRARLAIKPGITGLWQVSGRSNITDFEQVVELDKKYIREWSMGMDFRILAQTIKVVLRKEGSM